MGKAKRKKPYPPIDLFVNAFSFKAASMALHAQQERALFYWPTVVNESFSLELHLKCLHRVRRRVKTGHDLLALFDALSKKDRRLVTRHYEAIVVQHAQYAVFVSLGVPFDIRSVLKRSKDTFKRIRYWHEGEDPGRDSLGFATNAGTGAVVDAIREVIVKLRPEWEHIALRVPALDIPQVED